MGINVSPGKHWGDIFHGKLTQALHLSDSGRHVIGGDDVIHQVLLFRKLRFEYSILLIYGFDW